MIGAAAQTTFALTQASGSEAGNVLPTEARMFANLRLLWGDTTESVMTRLQTIMDDPAIEIVPHSCTDPRPDSELTQGWDKLQSAIHATWPQAIVTPYLMVACTDSRHWRGHLPQCLPVLRQIRHWAGKGHCPRQQRAHSGGKYRKRRKILCAAHGAVLNPKNYG